MPVGQMHKYTVDKKAPPPAQPGSLDDMWAQWSSKPTKESLNQLMAAANPVIDKAVHSYAPGSPPAVRSIAKVYARKAFDTYDPAKGTKLQTYLHFQLQPLRREAASYNTLHVPENVQSDLLYVQNERKRFASEYGRDPSIDELADRTKLSQKRLNHIDKFNRPVVSDTQLSEISDEYAESAPAVTQSEDLWETYVYDELPDRDKLIYDMRLGRNGQKTSDLYTIARKLKMTPGAVSQRLARISDRILEGAKYADISR